MQNLKIHMGDYHTCTHAHTYTHVHTYTHAHTYTHMHTHTHTHTHTQTHTNDVAKHIIIPSSSVYNDHTITYNQYNLYQPY